MKRFLLAFAALCLSSTTFAASMQSLSESEVNGQLKGKTITTIPMVTISGSMENNTFTGFFNQDGTLQGRMANKPSDGPIDDTGTWKVSSNGTLCATWQHWNDGKAICVAVYKVNNGLIFINEKTHKWETMVLDSNIKSGNQLS